MDFTANVALTHNIIIYFSSCQFTYSDGSIEAPGQFPYVCGVEMTLQIILEAFQRTAAVLLERGGEIKSVNKK